MIPNLSNLHRREAFGFWLNENQLVGQGAEVGCAYGANAGMILSQWHGTNLYMIDPWSKRPEGEYLEPTNDTANFEGWYADCQALAKQYEIVSLLRMPSIEGAKLFAGNQLDWVYIDGAHDYRNVLADLDAWWPKVKPGGVVAGHDFYNNTEPPHYCEVEKAVRRWFEERNLSFTVTPCTSWWSIKS